MNVPSRGPDKIWHFKGDGRDENTMKEVRSVDLTGRVRFIFDTQPNNDLCKKLQALVGKVSELTLVVSFGPKVWDAPCDLSFLAHFPRTKKLWLQYACGAKSFEPLRNLKELEYLEVHQTRSKKLSLKVLGDLKKLSALYLDHQANDIEIIASLPRLHELRLRSVTLPNLSFLENHPALRYFWLGLGGTRNLDSLQKTSITSLEIWRVSKLSDLTALSGIESLEELKLDQLKNVTRLPDFSRLKHLSLVRLEGMNELVDLSPFLTATALDQLTISEARKLNPESFRILRGHPALKRGVFRLGSDAKNKAVTEILPLRFPVSGRFIV